MDEIDDRSKPDASMTLPERAAQNQCQNRSLKRLLRRAESCGNQTMSPTLTITPSAMKNQRCHPEAFHKN